MNEVIKHKSPDIDLVDILVNLFNNKLTIIITVIFSIFFWGLYYQIEDKEMHTLQTVISENNNLKFEMTSTTLEFLESNSFSSADFFQQYKNILLNDNNFYKAFNQYENEEVKKLYEQIKLVDLSANSVSISLSSFKQINELEADLINLLNKTGDALKRNLLNLASNEIIIHERSIIDLKQKHAKRIQQKKSILEYQKKLNLAAFINYKKGLILELKNNIRIAKLMKYENPISPTLDNYNDDLSITDALVSINANAKTDREVILTSPPYLSESDPLNLVANIMVPQQKITYKYGYRILEERLASLEKTDFSDGEVKVIYGVQAELDNLDITASNDFIVGFHALESKLDKLLLIKDELSDYISPNKNNSLISWNLNTINQVNERLNKKISILVAIIAGIIFGSLFVLFKQAITSRK